MTSSFSLNTGKGRPLRGFENRASDVFGSLGGLEKDYDTTVKERGLDEFKEDDDRESPERDFKKPVPPRSNSGGVQRGHGSRQRWDHPRCRGRGGRSSYREGRGRTPDHKLHPDRWTKYSLEDTDISGESTNKRAAFDFLRDLRKRKMEEQRTEAWDADLHCGKVQYKKPATKSTTDDDETKRSSSNDVHTMPEFHFGQSKSRVRKLKPSEASGSGSSVGKSESISLGHLDDEEESAARISDQSNEDNLPTVQSNEGMLQTVQSDESCAMKPPKHPEETKSNSTEKNNDMPVFQKKAGKGKRHIRGRKTEEED